MSRITPSRVFAVWAICLSSACAGPAAPNRELSLRETEAALRQTAIPIEQTRLAIILAPGSTRHPEPTATILPSNTPQPTATQTAIPTLNPTAIPATSSPLAGLLPGLYLGFDGEFFGLDHEINLSGNSLPFVPGISGQGVLFSSGDRLAYRAAGNIDLAQGAIEFWLKPSWNGNDRAGYVFLEIGDGWFNRFLIQKDGANNLRFIVWSSDAEFGVACDVSHWIAGDWHHVRAVWRTDTLDLILDRLTCATEAGVQLPEVLANQILVGSSLVEVYYAEAVMDEFAIYLAPEACAQDFTRLAIGVKARIAPGAGGRNPIYDRPGSGGVKIANVLESLVVTVVSGPVCVDGHVFWKVSGSFIPGQGGWAAEGDGTNYWLDPVK